MKQFTRQTRDRVLDDTPSEDMKAQRAPFRRHEPSHQDIERRAYELYEERNGGAGSPLLDWIEAERELRLAAEDRAFARGEVI